MGSKIWCNHIFPDRAIFYRSRQFYSYPGLLSKSLIATANLRFALNRNHKPQQLWNQEKVTRDTLVFVKCYKILLAVRGPTATAAEIQGMIFLALGMHFENLHPEVVYFSSKLGISYMQIFEHFHNNILYVWGYLLFLYSW